MESASHFGVPRFSALGLTLRIMALACLLRFFPVFANTHEVWPRWNRDWRAPAAIEGAVEELLRRCCRQLPPSARKERPRRNSNEENKPGN